MECNKIFFFSIYCYLQSLSSLNIPFNFVLQNVIKHIGTISYLVKYSIVRVIQSFCSDWEW